MKKSQLIGGITFLVLAIVFYFVLSNSHISIFPGKTYIFDFVTGMHIPSGGEMISLLDHSRGYDPNGDYEQLSVLGYIVAAIVVIGIPGVIGYFTGKKLAK